MHPVDWNDPQHPLAQSEPRRGQRAVLAANVHTPQGALLCYCLHMEVCFSYTLFVEQQGLTAHSIMHVGEHIYGIARHFCEADMLYGGLACRSSAACWPELSNLQM